MARLLIHPDKLTPAAGEALTALCPFGAIHYENETLEIDAGCKLCRLCVKNGPAGVITYEEEAAAPALDKGAWQGVAVFAEQQEGVLHRVTLELLGKARQLAEVNHEPVLALLIGHDTAQSAQELLRYGADRVYVCDDPALADFNLPIWANAFARFVETARPSAILVGATSIGRSLAPRVAARFRTGLTADCTRLEMKENRDLVQIRPAFGGNIMAQIVTPRTRPQLCTVRYKIFSAPQPLESPTGTIETLTLAPALLRSPIELLSVTPKSKQVDISEAKVIVAVGRGLRSQADLALAGELAELLGAQLAGTRPLIEAGWLDPRRQIGLSGRTVAAKLIITLGVSGSVQFAAGMRGSECIIAVNADPAAPIFDIAHYGAVGDLYEIVPRLISQLKEGTAHV